jgi:hypothetical protein
MRRAEAERTLAIAQETAARSRILGGGKPMPTPPGRSSTPSRGRSPGPPSRGRSLTTSARSPSPSPAAAAAAAAAAPSSLRSDADHTSSRSHANSPTKRSRLDPAEEEDTTLIRRAPKRTSVGPPAVRGGGGGGRVGTKIWPEGFRQHRRNEAQQKPRPVPRQVAKSSQPRQEKGAVSMSHKAIKQRAERLRAQQADATADGPLTAKGVCLNGGCPDGYVYRLPCVRQRQQ